MDMPQPSQSHQSPDDFLALAGKTNPTELAPLPSPRLDPAPNEPETRAERTRDPPGIERRNEPDQRSDPGGRGRDPPPPDRTNPRPARPNEPGTGEGSRGGTNPADHPEPAGTFPNEPEDRSYDTLRPDSR
jgi:hypothetical protein